MLLSLPVVKYLDWSVQQHVVLFLETGGRYPSSLSPLWMSFKKMPQWCFLESFVEITIPVEGGKAVYHVLSCVC